MAVRRTAPLFSLWITSFLSSSIVKLSCQTTVIPSKSTFIYYISFHYFFKSISLLFCHLPITGASLSVCGSGRNTMSANLFPDGNSRFRNLPSHNSSDPPAIFLRLSLKASFRYGTIAKGYIWNREEMVMLDTGCTARTGSGSVFHFHIHMF